MVLVEVDPVVMLSSGVSAASGMLAVLANTAVTVAHVATVLAGLLLVGRHAHKKERGSVLKEETKAVKNKLQKAVLKKNREAKACPAGDTGEESLALPGEPGPEPLGNSIEISKFGHFSYLHATSRKKERTGKRSTADSQGKQNGTRKETITKPLKGGIRANSLKKPLPNQNIPRKKK